MQRLHSSDLSGHILDRGGFDHICLPYRYEPGRMSPTSIGWSDPRTVRGELLWPQADERLKPGFEGFAPRLDASQLQQRPVPEGGAIFHREWFKVVAVMPAGSQVAVRYWDKAATADAGDYSAGVLMVPHGGQWYVVDVVRGRWSAYQRNQIIVQTAKLDVLHYPQLTIVVEQEAGSGGKESAESTVRELAGYNVRVDRVTGTKLVRAQPLAGQCESGNIVLVQGAWNYAFIEELCIFPAGDHDDQVDAAAGAFSWCVRTPDYEAPSTVKREWNPSRYGIQIQKRRR